jgi:hypothetical protein
VARCAASLPYCVRCLLTLLSVCRVMLQGPKRPANWTDGRKKWNKGAPLSKKATGVGRGNGRKQKIDANEGHLETMPLPAERETITVPCMRAFLVDAPAVGTEPGKNEHAENAQLQPPSPPIPVQAGLEAPDSW